MESIELVNGEFKPADSGVEGADYYIKLNLINPTGYEVYQAMVYNYGENTVNDISGSGNTFYVPVKLKSGIYTINFKNFSYRLGQLDKTINVDEKIITVGYQSATPVEITTAEDLLNMGETGNYVLKNDIDLSGYQWQGNEFNGVFDGNGYTIKNMRVVTTLDAAELRLGLFTRASGIIRNLNFDRVTYFVTASNENAKVYYGAVAAQGISLILTNCHVKNSSVSITVTESDDYRSYIGGLIGESRGDVRIINCSNQANITANGGNVGGIAGNSDGIITDCTNTGTVSGTYNVGGIAGSAYGTITDCTNSGSVSGTYDVGGIACYEGDESTITNCTNTGEVIIKEEN